MSSEPKYSTRALPEAIDLSHHLSEVAKARAVSPLKGLAKYMNQPGIISLGGGLPSPSYFPFDTVKADILSPDTFKPKATHETESPFAWFMKLFTGSSADSTKPISVPKYPENAGDINLASSLQYGIAKGMPQLQDIIKEITAKIYKPQYSNFATLLHGGNTDGWEKSVATFCNPGEGVLVDDWTYPSAMAAMIPRGVNPVSVAMDGEGMSSSALREVLSGWDEQARGMPRPHVMYIVPVGQNPTGATMGAQRKSEIYNICVEFDILIVEDDPYYFLQEGPYVHPAQRYSSFKPTDMTDEQFIASLAPSFLRFDYQGRVVRLDTFSKVVAPGSRMGWFTCHPVFAERLERAAETSTQGASGFSQVLITRLLMEWQYTGFLQWLKGLGVEYSHRRDLFIDSLLDRFHLDLAPETDEIFNGSVRYTASAKDGHFDEKKGRKALFSFVPPTSGMFVWLKINFSHHPKIKEVGEETLEVQFWTALAESGLLVVPGLFFAADQAAKQPTYSGHLRISFSFVEDGVMKKAVDILAKVLKKFNDAAWWV